MVLFAFSLHHFSECFSFPQRCLAHVSEQLQVKLNIIYSVLKPHCIRRMPENPSRNGCCNSQRPIKSSLCQGPVPPSWSVPSYAGSPGSHLRSLRLTNKIAMSQAPHTGGHVVQIQARDLPKMSTRASLLVKSASLAVARSY